MLHFLGLRVAPALFKRNKTFQTCLMCLSSIFTEDHDFVNIDKRNYHTTLNMMTSEERWKVVSTLQSPKSVLKTGIVLGARKTLICPCDYFRS